ncbi:MAG: aldolase/citrate lyase family protein [Planctomycetota bacterium]|jgi:2-keto-3-deoxy-L-rhamnonate aldolase RhmA|nr:aldolase/citrate lyase family protein [Planctomycetota bacterium]
MRNNFKQLLRDGKPAFGAQLRLGSPAIAELFGLAGYDFIIIDSEHAPQTPKGIQEQLQGAGCTDATPIVRIPSTDPDLIKLYLDMGASGILSPFVNTPEEAERGGRACRYPPRGTRGWGPSRAAGYGLHAEAYTERSDDLVMFMPIIESAEAVENIDGILAVESVDTFIIGPVDLSISLGVPFQFDHPRFIEAEHRILDAAQSAGKPAGVGVQGSPFDTSAVREKIAQGFQVILFGGEEPFLSAACKKVIEEIKDN